MTTVTPAIQAWASRPIGKASRIALAVLGMASATLVLMTASVVASGSWALVLLGVGIAAIAVRTALAPTAPKLGLMTVAMVTVPFVISSL